MAETLDRAALAELRRRYGGKPGDMSCMACGAPMLLDPPERESIGVVWTWRCPRSPEHRPIRHIDHYGDLEVLALLALAERVAAIDPALLDRLAARYAADGTLAGDRDGLTLLAAIRGEAVPDDL